MLTLALFDATHIALYGSYAYKDTIKALADWPDVRWNVDAKAWLLHVALLPKLYAALPDDIAPASADFWMDCPLYQPGLPVQRRRSKQQVMAEKAQAARAARAAGRFGAALVAEMRKEKA